MTSNQNLGPDLTHDEMSRSLIESIRVMNELPISGAHSEVWSTIKQQLAVINNNIIRLRDEAESKKKSKKEKE